MATYREALKQKALESPSNQVSGSRTSPLVRIGFQHPVAKLLGKSFNFKEWENPRQGLYASRIIVWAFPFVRRALRLHAQFLGNIEIECENQKLKAIIDDFVKNVPLRTIHSSEWEMQKGLLNFIRTMSQVTDEDGLSFAEEVYEEGIPGIRALLLIPSDRFDFKDELASTSQMRKVLWYTGLTGWSKRVDPSAHFHILGFSFSPSSLWGHPLMRGGEFFAEFLIKVLVARQRLHSRFGNPPSLHTFTLKEANDEKVINRFIERTDEAEQRLVQAQQASEEGKSAAVTVRFSGDVTTESSLMADGAQGVASFDKEWTMLSSQLAILTDFPMEYLGFSSGSAGIGSDKFNVLNGFMGATTESRRSATGDLVTRIINNHLQALGYSPAQQKEWKLKWRELDTHDEKLIAETDKTVAETIEKTLANAMAMFDNGLASEEAVAEYLAEHGLGMLDLPGLGLGGGSNA